MSTALIVTFELGVSYYRWTCSEKYCWRRDRDGIEYMSVGKEATKNFGAYHSEHIHHSHQPIRLYEWLVK